MLKRMVGGNAAGAEELFNQVDRNEFVQLVEQETPTDSSSVSKFEPRNLMLEDIKLTLEQKQQMRRLKRWLVTCQVKQCEGGPPRHDDDQFSQQRDKLH